MMNLLNYTVNRHIKLAEEKQLTEEEAVLAKKVNQYLEEIKPLHRQDVLDFFGMSKHMFYKLKNKEAIQIPEYMTTKKIRVRKKT